MSSALWALGRGTGVVALVLFTLTLVLGILARSGRRVPWLGRFGTSDLHRTAALTGTGLVAVHVGTLLLDPYAQLRLVDVVFPFLGAYRPFWLGFGTLALDLLGVVTVVSLLRQRVGPRVFKAVHWATYALWPVALVHALGNGTDGATPWFRALAIVCIALVAAAVAWRLAPSYAGRGWTRAPQEDRMTTDTAELPRQASGRRLLDGADLDRPGHLPSLSLDALLATVDAGGLTGRGGAGFPTATKVRAVAGGRTARRPVVIGNAMEGEPLSHKDAVLLARSPELVLDGLEVLGRSLHARRLVLAVGPGIDPAPATAAARHRRVEVVPLAGGFVAGQETALVNQLAGRPPVPRDPFTRITESGLDGRPTLVLNAETLAQLALLVRYGSGWYRTAGLPDDPGTSLFTVTGSVRHPGVVEAERGTPLREVLAATQPVDPVAVLVGGYHGAWVPAADLGVRMTLAELAPYGASVGAGVLHVLGPGTCPLGFVAEVADYLAQESARQCGPCLNGLPHLAANLHRLASGVRDASLPAEIERMGALVTGRGACAHPDGTARFVASSLGVFRDHVAAHLQGWCPSRLQPSTGRTS